jgi:UbiD family decarboxylase
MADTGLRQYLGRLEDDGAAIVVDQPVSPEYDGPRRSAATCTTLIFNDLGNGWRGVMNLVSDRASIARALDLPPEGVLPTLAAARFDGDVAIDGGLTMSPADLGAIPIMKHYPRDAGPYITAGIVFSRYGGVQNASVHRMLVDGRDRLVARLVEGRHTYNLHRQALADGEPLPVAIAIGVHPAVMLAACTRVPEGKELAYAAELLGGELPVRECGNGVLVPDAEIVLEGSIGPATADEGPFVDITGTYDPVRVQPVIELEGMAIRPDPVYHGILPGGAEHKALMGAPYEPIIYRAVAGVTRVRNVVLTPGGCGYLHAVVQVNKATDGDGKNACMAAFAAHTSLKHVVVVDEDIDPCDMGEVEYAIATRVRGDRDLLVVAGARGSSLDPSRIGDGLNVKVGIDATMDLGREDEFVRAGWDDAP